MKKQDSKRLQFSKRDLLSWLYYAVIVTVWVFVPLIPEVTTWLIEQGVNPQIAGGIMTVVTILLKKLLTDYSK